MKFPTFLDPAKLSKVIGELSFFLGECPSSKKLAPKLFMNVRS